MDFLVNMPSDQEIAYYVSYYETIKQEIEEMETYDFCQGDPNLPLPEFDVELDFN